MAYFLSPVFQDAQLATSDGSPLVGGKLETYVAGSSTPVTTYQDNAGSGSHTNPIVLNARGEPPAPIWLAGGAAVKFILKTSADVTIRTIDNVYGVGDDAVATETTETSEWESLNTAPTYVSASSFTVSGNQTSTLHPGRRIKITVSGGTAYATIVSSAYTSLTTVTVDTTGSSPLDSSISALTNFSIGILRADNPSVPILPDTFPIASGSSDKTKKLKVELDGLTTGITRTMTVPDRDFFPVIGEDFYGVHNGALSVVQGVGVALTISLKTKAGNDPSSGDPVYIGFRSTTATDGKPVVRKVTSAISMDVSSGSTLGCQPTVPTRCWVGLIDNSGTVELIVWRSISDSGNDLTALWRPSEMELVNTTAEGGSGGADSSLVMYSTTSRSGVAWAWLGYFDITPGGSGNILAVGPDAVRTWRPGVPRPGDILQIKRSDTGTYASGTAAVPSDDTTPLNTEGISLISLSITATNQVNKIRATGHAFVSTSGAGEYLTLFLIKDTTLLRAVVSSQGANDAQTLTVQSFAHAGSGAYTYYLRGGGTSTSNTFQFNGYGTSQKYGNRAGSYLMLEEIMV